MKKQNSDLMVTGEVIAEVKRVMAGVYETLAQENPQLAQDLAAAAPALEALAVVFQQLDDVAAAALTAAQTAQRQRDMALADLHFERSKNEAGHLRDVAHYLSYELKIPPQDVERVLEVLTGRSDLPVSEYTKQDFAEQFARLAREVFEEEMYRKEAEAEEEAERGQE